MREGHADLHPAVTSHGRPPSHPLLMSDRRRAHPCCHEEEGRPPREECNPSTKVSESAEQAKEMTCTTTIRTWVRACMIFGSLHSVTGWSAWRLQARPGQARRTRNRRRVVTLVPKSGNDRRKEGGHGFGVLCVTLYQNYVVDIVVR